MAREQHTDDADREGSRLEVDDKRFCKRCGMELPEECFEHDIHPLGGGDPPEYCGGCLGEKLMEEVTA